MVLRFHLQANASSASASSASASSAIKSLALILTISRHICSKLDAHTISKNERFNGNGHCMIRSCLTLFVCIDLFRVKFILGEKSGVQIHFWGEARKIRGNLLLLNLTLH